MYFSKVNPMRLHELEKFNAKYKLGKTILDGELHALAIGRSKQTNQKVMIKSVFKNHNFNAKEIAILQKIASVPGVIHLLDHYYIKSNVYLLVLNNFDGQSLHHSLTYFGSFSETQSHKIISQIISTVKQCRDVNIVHRKLTTHNIMIKKLNIKITNFNSAAKHFPEHMAPFNAKLSKLNFNVAPPEYYTLQQYTADGLTVWSIGCLLYQLLFNQLPFDTVHDVVRTPLCIPTPNHISLELYSFLEWSLEKSISYRMTFNEMLLHPWITKKYI